MSEQKQREVIEAYNHALGVVIDLAASGIPVELKPSGSRKNPEAIADYSGPERLRPEKWLHIKLKPLTTEEVRLVEEKLDELRARGTNFDTGGGMGERDWEFDWSFTWSFDISKA